MRAFLAFRLAWREGRAGFRRLGVFMGAVALGVGALTGLHGFQQDAADSARREARQLLGGDLRVQSSVPFDADLETRLDSLAASGALVSRAVTLASVIQSPGSGRNRLLQVNAVDAAFPLVGSVVDEPAGIWTDFARGGTAVADAQVLSQLAVGPGDTIRLGESLLEVGGAVRGLPVDLGVQTIVGPPIFISLEDLPGTGLLTFGSLARYRAFVLLSTDQNPDRVAQALRRSMDGPGVGVRTARAEAESFADGFRNLARFLGLVGLMALLLGGIGVASAVHVYVQERIPSVAVLRCLGAPQRVVFKVYLLLALALGLAGSVVGIGLGVTLQFAIPGLLEGVLPFGLQSRLRPWTLLAGLAVGTWTAFLFALLPLLRVREIPPLAALRVQVESGEFRQAVPRVVVAAGLAVTLFALSALQTGGVRSGLVFAGALLGVLIALGLVAAGLARAARRFLPADAPFPLRQGIAGLFRPGNQTSAVLTALGFGAFLLGALLVVEGGLRASLSLELDGGEPSLLLFDIQEDQRFPIEELLIREGAATTLVPLAPARLASLRGVPVNELVGSREIPGWMARRVFRNTWRDELSESERMTAGKWWGEKDSDVVARQVERGSVRVSMEEEIAAELGLGVGDEIIWDVQGRPLPSVVTSLRRVDWASFRPNFYAVFEPGALEGAPVTYVGLVPAMDPEAAGRLQTALLAQAPNLSFLDVSVIRDAVERISGQVVRVLRALAAFAVVAGFLVLFASLLSGRFRRRREGALLKTLGAGRRTIRGALLSEYLVLGAVGTTSGLLLGVGGGVLALTLIFETSVALSPISLVGLWGGLVALTVLAGWTVSGPVLREPPLAMLRETEG